MNLSNIGAVYSEQGNHAKALEYYRKSLTVREDIGLPHGIALCLNNIGIAYFSQGNLAKALECYQKSLKIQEQIGDQLGVAISLNNIGNLYIQEKKYTQAAENLKRSLSISQQIGDQEGVGESRINLAKVSLETSQPTVAREYAQSGLALALEIGHRKLAQQGAQALYRADSALGNWKGAFEAHRLFKIYSDSLKNDDQSKELGRLESKYEFEKAAEEEKRQAEEEARLEAERTERRNSLQHLSIFAALIALFGALVFLGRFRVPVRVMDVALFAGLLILFEFLLVLFDPVVDDLSEGVPFYKLAFNTGIAVVLAPLHHFSIRALRRRLVKKEDVAETKPPSAD